jgi:type II secretory pathway predicted ATPase ExeA
VYSAYFGLRTNPFLPLSDPETILRSSQVRETLQHFLHAWQNHHGLFLLTGEVGTGKTTAIQAAVAELPTKTPVVFLPPTLSTPGELLDEMCHALSLWGARESKAERRRRLESSLAVHAAEGNKAVVVVDEAHLLPDTVLEHLRLLTNVRGGRHPVLQICLVGQPELVTRLRSDHLRQLRQRITLRYTMMPLSLGETELYLIERLRAAGARNPDAIFDPGAVRAIYRMTGGIPREINVVADQAMTNAFVNNARVVRKTHLLSVEGDFGFEGLFIDPGQSTTPTILERDIVAEFRPVSLHESPPEPMPILDPAAPYRAPAPGTMESSSHLEPQVEPPAPTESTPSFEDAPGLLDVLDERVRSIYRNARSLRHLPGAAILSALALAVVGVALLLSVSGLPTESARTTPPIAPTTPAALVQTAYPSTATGLGLGVTSPPPREAIEPPDAATREPQNVGDDGKTDPAIDHESRTVVSAVEPVTEPAPKPPPAGPSWVEERYPSTLEVASPVPVVVWLGEERLGTAPGSFSPVPPGRYQVKLELADGRIFSKDVIVTRGSTTYVRANWSDP